MRLFAPLAVPAIVAAVRLSTCDAPVASSAPTSGPPILDASAITVTDIASGACAQMVRLGCSDGQNAGCVGSMRSSLDGHLVSASEATCVSTAMTKAAARACAPGFVTCP